MPATKRVADPLRDAVNLVEAHGFRLDGKSETELRQQAARALLELMREEAEKPDPAGFDAFAKTVMEFPR